MAGFIEQEFAWTVDPWNQALQRVWSGLACQCHFVMLPGALQQSVGERTGEENWSSILPFLFAIWLPTLLQFRVGCCPFRCRTTLQPGDQSRQDFKMSTLVIWLLHCSALPDNKETVYISSKKLYTSPTTLSPLWCLRNYVFHNCVLVHSFPI